MAKKFSIMNRTGHTSIAYDVTTDEALAEAERIFDEHKKKGFAPFKVEEDGTTSGPLQTFDKEADEILMVPNIVGG